MTITYRGDPVAEVCPIEPREQSIEERFDDLVRRGIISPAENPEAPLVAGERRVPGALEDFLAHRHREL